MAAAVVLRTVPMRHFLFLTRIKPQINTDKTFTTETQRTTKKIKNSLKLRVESKE